jgi:glucose-1-phosphate cytidylyltransferase
MKYNPSVTVNRRSSLPVVLLAGGQGTRLREETEYRPKPMVNIGPWPILWHIMKSYAHYGHDHFVVCLGYKGDMIKDYFLNYRLRANDITISLHHHRAQVHGERRAEDRWKITLANTGLKAMTGARIKRIEPYIQSDEFLMTYGDGVSDVDIDNLLRFHRHHGKIATVMGVSPPSRFGELIAKGKQVIKFSEKPQTHVGLINGGFFVLNRQIFDYLSSEDDCIFERKPMEQLAQDGQLMVYPHRGFWQCMDTLRDTQYLNELWDRGEAPWKVW